MEIAQNIYDRFRAIDVDGSGMISWKEVQLNGGMVAGRQISRAVWLHLDKDRSGYLSLLELCVYWFPKTPSLEVSRMVKEVEESYKERRKEAILRAKANEKEYQAKAKAQKVAKESAIKEAKDNVKVCEETRDTMKKAYIGWLAERPRRRVRRRKEFEWKKKTRRLRIEEEMKPHARLPFVRTCSAFPLATTVNGLRLTQETLSLDVFVQTDSTRALAATLLSSLSASGICTSYLAKGNVPRLSTPPVANHCRVYRDFTRCTARGMAPLVADMAYVHVKTSIRAQSDVMYRVLFEGQNWGVNQPVNATIVGYASRGKEVLDNLESYGWPMDWDKGTKVGMTSGLRISQYYSSDGFVTFRLQARSLTGLGLSASAWLVFHSHGAGRVLTAEWIHQEEDI